ncbi:polyprenal reductase [Myripristis murdjan]|uniref:Polyprenal reductase n=1 Tax=Myripristis murdjan TaxID=586833 RepID=A0A668ARI0_9TELE|nr:polyprenol reductase [Myripristis murdjan]
MPWSPMGFCAVDALWSFLSLCFFSAYFVHKVSLQWPKTFERSCVYVLFQDLIRYGKTKQNVQRDKWLRVFDVPKRWFWHFYALSVGWNGLLLALSFSVTLQSQPYPSWLTRIVELLTGVPRPDSQVPQVSTLLVQLLLWLHCLRRLLECLLVSVFSDGAIHLVQYVFGLGYYIMLGLTVLCSDHVGLQKEAGTLLSQLDWLHVAGTALYIWASLLQHHCMVTLARLRTGNSGTVQTLAHRVPEGGWFNLVSCPHYFAELLIYVSLSLVSGGLSLTWWLVVLYVLFNQGLAAQLCHEFYISKYNSYPRHRTAFIPFVL